MKQFLRLILSFAVVVSAAAGMVSPALAAESSVIFRRGSEWFSFAPGSGYTASDLFDGFKDVMPGDILTEAITITNKNSASDAVHIYLRSELHDEDDPLDYSEDHEARDGKDQQELPGQRDETEASVAEFLSQLTMRVYHGDRLVYEGSAEGTGGLERNIYLGSISRNRSLRLRVELEVPVALDNRYANRVGEVDWVFTAVVYKDPVQTDVPKTGDNIGAAALALTISAGLLLLAAARKTRKK